MARRTPTVDICFNASFKSTSLCYQLYVIHRHCFYFWLLLVLDWLLCGSSAYFNLLSLLVLRGAGTWSVAVWVFLCVHVVLVFIFSFLLSGYLDLLWHSQKQKAAAGEIWHRKDTEHGTDLKITLTGLVRKIQMTELKLRRKMKPIDVKAVSFMLKLALLVVFKCL